VGGVLRLDRARGGLGSGTGRGTHGSHGRAEDRLAGAQAPRRPAAGLPCPRRWPILCVGTTHMHSSGVRRHGALVAAWLCVLAATCPPLAAGPQTTPGAPVTDYDKAPKPIRITRPTYPRHAFDKKVEGKVVLEILIGTTGRVERARVVQSVPLLDEAALATVYEWTFEPAVKNGKQVATIALAPVDSSSMTSG